MAKKKTQTDPTVIQDQIEEHLVNRSYTSMRNVGEVEQQKFREAEERMRSEFSNYYNFFRSTYHSIRDQRIGAYCMVDLEREQFLKCNGSENSTNLYFPVVRSRVDFAIQTLFRGKVSNIVRTLSRDRGSGKKVKAMQNFLDSTYSSGGAMGAIKSAGFDAALLGVGFFVNDFFVTDNNYGQGSFEWVDPYSVYFDPQRNFYNTPVFFRKIDDIDSVLENDKLYFQNYKSTGYKLDEEQIKYIINNPQPISDENPGNIRNIKFTKGMIVNGLITTEDFYKVEIKYNTVEYIRRESKSSLMIMINGYLVYDGKNPRGNHPIKIIKKSAMPGTEIQDGIAGEIEPFQTSYNAIQNLILDTQKMNVGPMFFVKPGTKIPKKYLNKDGKLIWDAYRMIEVESIEDGKSPITPWFLPNASPELFRLASDILNTSNVLGGQFNYAQFQTQSRVQSDADMRRQTLADSVVTLSESTTAALSRVNDELIAIAKAKGIETINYFTINKDNKQVREEVTKEDLAGNYIFETEFESIKDINISIERTQLIEFLGYLNIVGRDPVTGRFLFDMGKLVPKLLEMFPTLEEDVILSEEGFYSNQKNAQEKEMKLKAELQAMREKYMPTQKPNQFQPEGPGQVQVQGKSFDELYG